MLVLPSMLSKEKSIYETLRLHGTIRQVKRAAVSGHGIRIMAKLYPTRRPASSRQTRVSDVCRSSHRQKSSGYHVRSQLQDGNGVIVQLEYKSQKYRYSVGGCSVYIYN